MEMFTGNGPLSHHVIVGVGVLVGVAPRFINLAQHPIEMFLMRLRDRQRLHDALGLGLGAKLPAKAMGKSRATFLQKRAKARRI